MRQAQMALVNLGQRYQRHCRWIAEEAGQSSQTPIQKNKQPATDDVRAGRELVDYSHREWQIVSPTRVAPW